MLMQVLQQAVAGRLAPPAQESASGSYVALPISRVSLSPFETNYYLMRGEPYALGKPPKEPLAPFVNGGARPPTCAGEGCSTAPTAFCSTQVCPPLTAPFAGGCLASALSESGRRETVVVPPTR